MKTKLISIFVILLSFLSIQSFVYAEEGTSTDSTWTDFSKAEYKISYRTRNAELSVSNVTPIIGQGHSYYYLITASNTKPSFDFNDFAHNLSFTSTNDVTSYLELNQDLYLWVVETNSSNEHNFVVEGKKLDRPEYPKYSDIFSSILLSSDEDRSNISFYVPWASDHTRKINLKIGKIEDVSILNKIKNKENDAFQKLLEYSKISNTIYNNQLTSQDSQDGFYAAGWKRYFRFI